jgi:hypothetical protein
LTVQRDSAHRQMARLDTQNRLLLQHQADIRDWLRDAIAQWEAVADAQTWDRDAVGHRIHKRAIELLGEAEKPPVTEKSVE